MDAARTPVSSASLCMPGRAVGAALADKAQPGVAPSPVTHIACSDARATKALNSLAECLKGNAKEARGRVVTGAKSVLTGKITVERTTFGSITRIVQGVGCHLVIVILTILHCSRIASWRSDFRNFEYRVRYHMTWLSAFLLSRSADIWLTNCRCSSPSPRPAASNPKRQPNTIWHFKRVGPSASREHVVRALSVR